MMFHKNPKRQTKSELRFRNEALRSINLQNKVTIENLNRQIEILRKENAALNQTIDSLAYEIDRWKGIAHAIDRKRKEEQKK